MRTRKLFSSLLACYLMLGLAGSGWSFIQLNSSLPVAHADVKGASTERTSQEIALSAYPVVDKTLANTIDAKSFLLYDTRSGKEVLSSSSDEPVAIASTTKLMTAYVIHKIGDPRDVVTISEEAANRPIESSLMGIHKGETIGVHELLTGALIVSGNDAAYALAEYGGGILLKNESASSEEKTDRFIKEMNKTARELHMEDTVYKDSIGFDDEGYSTALSLAKLTSRVIQVPELASIVGTAFTTVYSSTGFYRYDLRNSNRLIADYNYAGSIGGKTGYTPAAGHCLVTAATRDGHTFIAVILHTTSETNEASAVEARKLLEIGYNQVSWR